MHLVYHNELYLQEMYKHDRILNLNKLYTNHIHAIAETYGIEAACKVIIKVCIRRRLHNFTSCFGGTYAYVYSR